MADFRETCFDCTDADSIGTFCSSEKKWINKIYKLKDKYPDDVNIIFEPDDNHGVLYAHIPKSWLKISPPKKMNLTDEQKAERAARMRQIHST